MPITAWGDVISSLANLSRIKAVPPRPPAVQTPLVLLLAAASFSPPACLAANEPFRHSVWNVRFSACPHVAGRECAAATRYLAADPAHRFHLGLGSIGYRPARPVFWAGNPRLAAGQARFAYRSPRWRRLGDTPGISFVSLAARRGSAQQRRQGLRFTSRAGDLNDFADTAARSRVGA